MSVISRQTTWSDNQVLTATALNAEFNNILNDYNGGITNANISASAAIAVSKIATGLSGSLVGTSDTQSLTNKTITDSTNNVTARSLKSATTTVDVSAAAAPSSGQVLTATASTTATWQTPSVSILVQAVHTQTGAVATGTTTLPYDDTIPQNTEGDQYLTLAITPTSATNKLLIEAVLNLGHTSATAQMAAALFQDTTAGALSVGSRYTSTANTIGEIVLRYEMTAGTTSATTFKVRAGADVAGTTTLNGATTRAYGGVLISSLRITEIKV